MNDDLIEYSMEQEVPDISTILYNGKLLFLYQEEL